VLIEVENARCRVAAASEAETAWLSEFLAFEDRSYMGGGRKIRMFQKWRGTFPRGFLHLVERGAVDERMKVEVIDRRKRPPLDINADLAWLRDYQRGAVDSALTEGQGIIWISTGGGKGEVAVGLVRRAPYCKWLFLVHREQLVLDVADRYEKRTSGIAGRIGGGTWSEGAVLTCTTFQSFRDALVNDSHPHHARAKALAASVGGFIADEGHVVASQTYWATVMALTGAYYRIAMSGTPLDRTDKRSLLVTAATGKVVARVRAAELIAAGVLSKPTIRMIPCEQPSVAGRKLATHQEMYRELVAESGKRNALLVEMAQAAEKPALLFVQHVAHGRELERLVGRTGLRTGFTHGTDSVRRRQDKISALVRGDLDVLVCSGVFQEGIDIPTLASVVIGTAGKSVIAALQRIGRGMRVAAGKTTFEVWDVLDRKTHRWLDRHALARFAAYGREKHEVVVLPAEQLSLMARAKADEAARLRAEEGAA
jgi:superfamily II DNA or RNA helicase